MDLYTGLRMLFLIRLNMIISLFLISKVKNILNKRGFSEKIPSENNSLAIRALNHFKNNTTDQAQATMQHPN